MRQPLSFVIALAGVLVVGCTSTVEGQTPACSATFAGQWTIVDTLGITPKAGCTPPPDTLQLSVSVDDALSTWTEVLPDGTTTRLKVSNRFNLGNDSCGEISADLVEKLPTGTQVTSRLLVAHPETHSMNGMMEISLYENADFEANGGKATPLCDVTFTTTATR